MSCLWRHRALALNLLVLLSCPSPVPAADGVRFGISVSGGYAGTQMTDVNRQTQAVLDEVNTAISTGGGQGQVILDDVRGGLNFGGGIHAWVGRDFLVSVEYERLLGKSENDATAAGRSYHTEIETPANAFTLTGAYFLPSSSSTRIGLSAGAGYYTTTLKRDYSMGGQPVTDLDLGIGTTGGPVYTGKLEGDGFGFHVLAVRTMQRPRRSTWGCGRDTAPRRHRS